MQSDGNFVLYSKGNGIATWATRTDRNNGATLHMQDDGNLVVYTTGNQQIWSSSTVLNPKWLLQCPEFPGKGSFINDITILGEEGVNDFVTTELKPQ